MCKYITKKQCIEFLLSLDLIDCNLTDKEKIKLLYLVSNNKENNYKIIKIKKRNGKLRTIYEPNYLLKSIQRKILKNILNNKSISKYAKAYHIGISLKDNAIPHLNKKIVLKLDIKNFFDSINFVDIYKSCFPLEYFPKSVGMLLTYLCTYYDYLPQGAPTSSYISNLVMKDFDEEIGNYCENLNISYTRYSDDMTFSGDFNPSEIIKVVRTKLYKLGLKLNNEKICIINKGNRQSVTGINVNNKIQVSVEYRKKLRQEIYFIKKYGLSSHLKFINYSGTKETYISSLLGRVNYVLQINSNDKEFIKYKKYIGSEVHEKLF